MSQPTRRELLQNLALSVATVALPACARRTPEVAEVCIVGSGPAGAVLGLELATRGVRTLLIEGGPFPSIRRERVDDTFPIAATEPLQYPIDNTRFLGEGGTSNLWNARCPRFRPFDFDAANPSLPPGVEWPVSYSELEPYYRRAEHTLRVSSGAPTTACLSNWLESAGWRSEPPPIAEAARMTATHLPAFTRSSNATLMRDARVVGIAVDGEGRCSGFQLRSGSITTVARARLYVLACGGIETPRLLLHSKSRIFPSGLGNRSDQVGRHFMEHLGVEAGTIQLPASLRCQSPVIEDRLSWQLYDELKKDRLSAAVLELTNLPTESAIRIGAVIEMKPRANNRVVLSSTLTDVHGAPAAELAVNLSDDERNTWTRVQAAGRRISQSLPGSRFLPGPPEAGWCHHHMGACRMGLDPATSVVNRDLRVHDVPNLYVAGSAPFVTGGVGSPTLLLTALSIRLADHLVSRIESER